jgi:hypothetical protein
MHEPACGRQAAISSARQGTVANSASKMRGGVQTLGLREIAAAMQREACGRKPSRHARARAPRARANLRVHTGAMASVSKLREARRAAAKPPGARPPGWHPFHVQQKIDLLPDSVCLRCAVCQRHHERTAECEKASLISSNSCRSECDMPPATCSVLHAGGAQARGWPRSSVIVAPRNIATHELRAVPRGNQSAHGIA